MCGIAGFSGNVPALPILVNLLERLEYRGYDSSGLSLATEAGVDIWKKEGSVEELRKILPIQQNNSEIGLAHTRWATHGKPSDKNAHPLLDCTKNIAIAHNGVIDNYLTLKRSLLEKGHFFSSDTDSEVIAHLVEERILQGLSPENAFREVCQILEGSFAIGALIGGNQPYLLASRNGSPVVIGVSSMGFYISSDVAALQNKVNEVQHLSDGQMVVIRRNQIQITNFNRDTQVFSLLKAEETSNDPFDYKGHSHYMHKEIWEQSTCLKYTYDSLIPSSDTYNNDIESTLALLNRSSSLLITGCGSSYFAGLASRYWFERFSHLSVELDIASEIAYMATFPRNRYSSLLISQSGETADVLAAMKTFRAAKLQTISLTNNKESELSRQSDISLQTNVGPEIAVASTKTFTAQLIVLAGLALRLGHIRGVLSKDESNRHFKELLDSIQSVTNILEQEPMIVKLAEMIFNKEEIFVLGRGVDHALSLETALKFREIAYTSSQGFPAAELKHGNLALFTSNTPTICLTLQSSLRTRMQGNIEEVKARGVPVIIIGCGKPKLTVSEGYTELLLDCPDNTWNSIPGIIAMHLLTYHIALLKGQSIDRPRNLAKSSTVQ